MDREQDGGAQGPVDEIRPPLEGIRVFDATKNFAGPYATLIFADLGADVIKIEEPSRGDEARFTPPFTDDGISAMFASYNRGKRSVTLNLKDPEDVRRALDIAATCHIFIENLRPGRATSLGLGWEAVRAVRPDVVYCSISAFGGAGARSHDPGYDATIQAYSGLMDLTGARDGPPSRVGTGLIDIGTGMWAALNVLAVLPQVQATGRGVLIASPMVETAATLMLHHVAGARLAGARPTRSGTAQHNMAPYEALAAKDEDVLVAAASQALWERLCALLGAEALLADPRFTANADRVANRDALVEELEAYTRRYAAAELEELLHSGGIPASVIRPVHEFAQDPQLDALGVWQPVPGSDLHLPVTPFHLGGWRPGIAGGVPTLGEHTDEVLREVEDRLGAGATS